MSEIGKTATMFFYHGGKGLRDDDTDLLMRALWDVSQLGGYLSGMPVRPAGRLLTGLEDAWGVPVPFHEKEETEHQRCDHRSAQEKALRSEDR